MIPSVPAAPMWFEFPGWLHPRGMCVSLPGSSGSRDHWYPAAQVLLRLQGVKQPFQTTAHQAHMVETRLDFPFPTPLLGQVLLTLSLWPTGELGFMHTGEDKPQYAGAYTVLL